MFTRQQTKTLLGNFDQLRDPTANTEENTAARARYKRFLSNAIRYLPPKQSRVVVLYFLDELNMQEIAQRLGIHQSTVCRRLAAARQTLRELADLCERSGLFPS